jgi:hypothetical protein
VPPEVDEVDEEGGILEVTPTLFDDEEEEEDEGLVCWGVNFLNSSTKRA